ncbi:protein PFC0760c-like [Leptopilina heterotoma]|uniref:protein PFC0760c-like n=1 Tax=Leptopilina heterotoma TaxID=63436 RepID=UPI001CA964D8|nr:protein PFC0760c-like [Leptopilina heterotoma]XP_043472009.1 protein PFC0760c-like [Leptopilina heterotoma]
MSRDWTVLRWQFFCLILLGFWFVDGRHHQDDDDNQVVHRHRHRHESPSSPQSSSLSSTSSRWHHNYPRSWRDDEDYNDADDESENDYHSQLYSRSYLKNYRDKYDSRHFPYYRDKQAFSTRRRKTHFGSRARNHRIRPSRDRTRKNSWEYDDDDEDTDYYDYDKLNRYDDDSNEDEEFYPIRRMSRKHMRMGDYENDDSKGRLERWDWKFKNSIRKDVGRDRRRKFRNSRNRFHDLDNDNDDDRFVRKISKLNVTRHDYDKTFDDDLFLDDEENETEDYDDDTWYPTEERRRYPKDRKYDEERYRKYDEERYSKDRKSNEERYRKPKSEFPKYSPDNEYSSAESKYSSKSFDTFEKLPDKLNDDDEDNGMFPVEDELKNDFYENDVKPSMKKYDDIIRRLTSNDPTTPKSEVRRDYRNIEIGKYLKRDAYGNLKYEPKNMTKIDLDFVTIGNIETTTEKIEENLNSSSNRIDGEITIKVVPGVLNLTKSSEQDYDYGGNEQDDDPSTQTDGNNAVREIFFIAI